MNIVVLGATGRTGRAVVRLAHQRGHQVTAAARTATTFDWPEGVRAASVDIRDRRAVADTMNGADAAIMTVGIGGSRKPTSVYSTGVDNLLSALSGLAVTAAPRLAVVSALPVGPRDALPTSQRFLSAVLDRFFGSTYADMRRMEATLAESTIAWTCLRPPRLSARMAKGKYQLDQRPLGGAITIGDLASALLDVLDMSDKNRQFLYVSN